MTLVFSALVFLAVVVAALGLFVHLRGEGAAIARRLSNIGQKTAGAGSSSQRTCATAPPWVTMRCAGSALPASHRRRSAHRQCGAGAAAYLAELLIFHRTAPAMLFGDTVTAPFFLSSSASRSAWPRSRRSSRRPDLGSVPCGRVCRSGRHAGRGENGEPVRSEFAITVDEQSLGLDFADPGQSLAPRDSLDLRFFVTAVVRRRAAAWRRSWRTRPC